MKMADRVGLNLQAGLNVSQTTANMEQQINKIQDALKPLNINVDNATLIQAFDKVTSSIKIASDGAIQLKNNVINVASEEGKLVQITQNFGKTINDASSFSIKVTDNIKAQRLEAEKLASTLQNAYSKQYFDNFNASIGIGTTSSNSAKASASVYQADFAQQEAIIQQQQELNNLKDQEIAKYGNLYDWSIRQQEVEQQINSDLIKQQMQEESNLETETRKTSELERQIALYTEQKNIQLQGLNSQFGNKLYNNTQIQSQISGIQGNILNLNPENFKEQSQEINNSISQVRANLNTLKTESQGFASDLVGDFSKMMAWSLVKFNCRL